ncbi:TonB-dependent receptor [Iodidimonas sp. SYSU 1G8]|uniref:TonB-dependent receptor family protein n=1 Tax=Iodidimonas sp. SYSU 1G8 TaxID=3133967 RepID=UPI0031FF2483
MSKKTRYAALVAPALMLTTHAVLAQGIGQRQDIDAVIVTAATQGTATAPSVEEARTELERIPGGIGFVEDSVFEDDFTQSIGDALSLTPGVFADTSAQRESRISIRGSGLNSGFERRGLTVLRDGVPISRASGSTEFQEVDPLTIRYLEVFKGANGLRFGAASLGGAVNVVSPTGRTAKAPFSARLEGGSFSTLRGNVSVAGSNDDVDYYVGVTGLRTNGFRDHSDVRSFYGHGNLGWKINDTVETRFYFTALSDNFELAGSLRLADALENPRAAGRPVQIGPFFPGGPVTVLDPGPVADDWDRNLDVYRIANLTSIDLGGATLEVGGWYTKRQLDHAITRFAGIIAQDEDEIGATTRLTGEFDLFGGISRWTIGGSYAFGSNDARTYVNDFGDRGALRSRADQDSSMLIAYGELDLSITQNLRAVLGGQYARAVRDVAAEFNSVSGRGAYDQFNPRIGLIADIGESAQLYGNVSRSFEPPSLADLTSGGAAPFAPLAPQKATTFEVGARGQQGFVAWDISLYRSHVANEFLDVAINNGASSVTSNGDDTIHQGIELGIDVFIARDMLEARGQSLRLSTAYTLSDFRFDDDTTYGNNRLPGVPRHMVVSEIRFDQKERFYVSANLRWAPQGTWADYANTERAPGYELVGLTAGVNLSDGVTLFGSVENLFNVRYISNVGTVANQSRERAAIYTPGQGRAFYIGVSAGF